jgi:hypothetical protein
MCVGLRGSNEIAAYQADRATNAILKRRPRPKSEHPLSPARIQNPPRLTVRPGDVPPDPARELGQLPIRCARSLMLICISEPSPQTRIWLRFRASMHLPMTEGNARGRTHGLSCVDDSSPPAFPWSAFSSSRPPRFTAIPPIGKAMSKGFERGPGGASPAWRKCSAPGPGLATGPVGGPWTSRGPASWAWEAALAARRGSFRSRGSWSMTSPPSDERPAESRGSCSTTSRASGRRRGGGQHGRPDLGNSGCTRTNSRAAVFRLSGGGERAHRTTTGWCRPGRSDRLRPAGASTSRAALSL